MARRPRGPQLTDAQRKELWQQWRKGHTFRDIARGLGSNHTTVWHVVRAAGGFPPVERRQIVDAVSIRERPAEVQDRAVPGHWEGDLISGARNGYIATLVERHSRFVMLVGVENKSTQTVVPALSRTMKMLPAQLRSTLTWDRGLELAAHKDFTIATDIAVYFCDPHSPWQKGFNENTNGLLRQYLPRKDDFSRLSQMELDQIAHCLNSPQDIRLRHAR